VYLLRCLVIVLLACPVTVDADVPSAQVATSAAAASAQEAVEARRALLEQRVMARWDALIRKDFETAYSFTTPAYRNLFSLDAFRRNFAVGKVVWRRIEVVDVDFKGEDAAMVGINIHFVYYQAPAGNDIEMTTYTQEPWVQVDGQWWHLMKE
jgi:hypothetical protein